MSEDSAASEGGGITVTVATAAEMRGLGRVLATQLRGGDLIILSGGLGAGKTTLTQGIGDGLGVRGPITSPTFVIARVHPSLRPAGQAPAGNLGARGPALVHADAYRLGSVLELDDLDLDTDAAASVTVVEWGAGLAEGLAADRLEITISPAAGSATTAVAGPSCGSAGSVGGAAAVSGAEGEADGEAEPDEVVADTPRTVRISAVGKRWEGVNLAFASLADRL